MSAILLINY